MFLTDFLRLQAMGASCTGGMPSSCSAACAAAFIPFYNDCGALLQAGGAGGVPDMAPLYAQCQAACPTCPTTSHPGDPASTGGRGAPGGRGGRGGGH